MIQPELTDAETNYHLHMNFHDANTVTQLPEFKYKNHLIKLKESDLAIMIESLKQREDEEAKLAAEARLSQASLAPVPAGKGGKPDPKAAAAKKVDPKKGAVVTEDPNSPKEIVIDYPQDVKSLPNYLILDRSYTTMKQ